MIGWEDALIISYVNDEDQVVTTSVPEETTSFRLVVELPEGVPVLELTGFFLMRLGRLLNVISGIAGTEDLLSLDAVLRHSLDSAKFALNESSTGSFKTLISGPKKALTFFRDHCSNILAVCVGKGERLAEAHLVEKEATAMVRMEDARQAKVETLSKALALTNEVGKTIRKMRKDLDDESFKILMQSFFGPTMMELTELVAERDLKIELEELDYGP